MQYSSRWNARSKQRSGAVGAPCQLANGEQEGFEGPVGSIRFVARTPPTASRSVSYQQCEFTYTQALLCQGRRVPCRSPNSNRYEVAIESDHYRWFASVISNDIEQRSMRADGESDANTSPLTRKLRAQMGVLFKVGVGHVSHLKQ